MFILKLKYSKPLEEVDKLVKPHTKYLEKYCSLQKFICTGRLNPRTGGIIICNAKDKEEIETLIEEDPFYINEVAEYEIIDFLPKVYAEGFEEYIK